MKKKKTIYTSTEVKKGKVISSTHKMLKPQEMKISKDTYSVHKNGRYSHDFPLGTRIHKKYVLLYTIWCFNLLDSEILRRPTNTVPRTTTTTKLSQHWKRTLTFLCSMMYECKCWIGWKYIEWFLHFVFRILSYSGLSKNKNENVKQTFLFQIILFMLHRKQPCYYY